MIFSIYIRQLFSEKAFVQLNEKFHLQQLDQLHVPIILKIKAIIALENLHDQIF